MRALHATFARILDAHAPAQPGVYRGWTISFDYPPIPVRDFDWSATSPNYDASYEGPEDGWVATGEVVHAGTREALIAAIDAAIEEEA